MLGWLRFVPTYSHSFSTVDHSRHLIGFGTRNKIASVCGVCICTVGTGTYRTYSIRTYGVPSRRHVEESCTSILRAGPTVSTCPNLVEICQWNSPTNIWTPHNSFTTSERTIENVDKSDPVQQGHPTTTTQQHPIEDTCRCQSKNDSYS
jgi:hypothetical protein